MRVKTRRVAVGVLAAASLALAPLTAAHAATGTISGVLRLADGTIPQGASVDAQSVDGDDDSGTSVDPDTGAYRLDVDPGSYRVSYSVPGIQWYAPASATEDGAQAYAVTAGDTTTLDLTAPAPTGFAGTITSASTSKPLKSVCVSVTKVGAADADASDCTGSAGTYHFLVHGPGSYRMFLTDQHGVYVSEWYSHSPTKSGATTLSATEGETTSVDAALTKGGVVTGRVVSQTSRKPVKGACALAYAGRAGSYLSDLGGACSDADGHFRITGLPTGSFMVKLDHNYQDPWAPGPSRRRANGKLYAVRAGHTTSVGTVLMPPAARLSGVVRDTAGKPIKGAWVSTDYSFRADAPNVPFADQTDSKGRYSITNLVPGKRILNAWTKDLKYAVSFDGSATYSKAKPLTLHGGKTAHRDFTLHKGATVKGVLEDSAGHQITGIGYVGVDAFTASGTLVYLGSGWDTQTGTFTLRGLPATAVVVRVLEYEEPGSPRFYYNRAKTRATATVLHLTAGRTRTITIHAPS